MAIEIIPKKKEERVSSIGAIAWYIGLGLLIVSILTSVVFLFLARMASQRIGDIGTEIKAKKTQEILDLESKIREQNQIAIDFDDILNNRISPIPMLNAIEKNIHPKVLFSDLQIDTAGKTIRASGVAIDITAFDQQKRLFEKDEMIINSGMSEFTREDDGKISFPIAITFSDQLFKIKR